MSLPMVILVVAVALAVLLLSKISNCLDQNDFSTLAGYTPVEPFTPIDSFYTDYMLFTDDSATIYDNVTDEGKHGNTLLSGIATFYANLPNKPMLITISGDYLNLNDATLTDKRLAAVHASLIGAGVHEQDIILKNADYVDVDNEAEDIVSQDRIYISITAAATCK